MQMLMRLLNLVIKVANYREQSPEVEPLKLKVKLDQAVLAPMVSGLLSALLSELLSMKWSRTQCTRLVW